MKTILRPLFPLLMLAPLIATTAVKAEAPLPTAPVPISARASAPAGPFVVVAPDRAAQLRLLVTVSRACVRTGNRMIC